MTLHTSAPRWLIALLVIPAFIAVDTIGLGPFRALAGDWTGWPRIAALAALGYGLYLLVPLVLAAILFGPRRAVAAIGLGGSVLEGLGVSLACTAVMLVGFAVSLPFAPPANAGLEAFRGALIPGPAEEVLYRAFLFGFLFRFAGWGFLPAALLNGLLFGAAHLHQGHDLGEALGVFAITGLGAALFSWLYAEWRYNLWVPIGLHVLMNLYWMLFSVDDSALGGGLANGLRLGAILACIALTVVVARRRGGRVVRGRAWLWGGPRPMTVAEIPPAS